MSSSVSPIQKNRQFQEKRDFIRMQVHSPATLTLESGESFQLTCIDLSSGGAQLISNQAIPEGSKGQLIMESGSGSVAPLTASITVCRMESQTPGHYCLGVNIQTFL